MSILKRYRSLRAGFILPWFLLAVSNIAAPPSLNTLGEIYAIISLIFFSADSLIFLAPIVFLAAAYSLTLFNRVIHKKKTSYYPQGVKKRREYLFLLIHWAPVFVLISKVGDFFCCSLNKIGTCGVSDSLQGGAYLTASELHLKNFFCRDRKKA